jgi:hypothetical protein
MLDVFHLLIIVNYNMENKKREKKINTNERLFSSVNESKMMLRNLYVSSWES